MLIRIRSLIIILAVSTVMASAATDHPPTFTRDVMPILQKECQGCHRPGEAGPFSMLSYEQTRPWAAAMKQAVKTHKMPPWFADPRYGTFTNGKPLTQAEIDTIVAWAD